MDTTTIITIIFVGIAALSLIIFLIWKNKKDRKKLNPDAEDSVEETIGDQERNKERI